MRHRSAILAAGISAAVHVAAWAGVAVLAGWDVRGPEASGEPSGTAIELVADAAVLPSGVSVSRPATPTDARPTESDSARGVGRVDVAIKGLGTLEESVREASEMVAVARSSAESVMASARESISAAEGMAARAHVRHAAEPETDALTAAQPAMSGSAPAIENSGAERVPAAGAAGAALPAGAESPRPKAGNTRPEYPRTSRARGEAGTAVVRLVVGRDGLVRAAAILRSSGYERLDAAAGTALAKWAFEPAREGDGPVEAEIDIPVVFSLSPVRH